MACFNRVRALRRSVVLAVALAACSESPPEALPAPDATEVGDVAPGEPWREIVGPGPGKRWGHVAVLDGKRARMIVWGGTDDGGKKNDAWALSLDDETWQALPAPGGPTARYTAGAVIDAARDRMIVLGGDDGAARGDVWALDLAAGTWTELPAGPSARFDVAAATDGGTAWFFAGFAQGFVALGDLWALDLGTTTWRELPTADPRPSPRTNGGFGVHSGSLWVVGGHDAAALTPDVWRYDLAGERWKPVTPPGGLDGWAHFAYAVDGACGVLWLVGADNNDTVDLPLVAGLVLGGAPRFVSPTFAATFPARRHAVVALDSGKRRLIVMGGAARDDTVYGDTWLSPTLTCP